MIHGIRKHRLVAIALVALLPAAAILISATRSAATETTIIVVRHAEKAKEPGDDPPLSQAGSKRAAALRHALEKAGVAAIYATQYRRTQKTVEPLAAALGKTVTQVDAKDAEKLAARIREKHRGETVVVAGHSNTVPAIIKAFGAPQPPAIAETDYDNLFVVTVPESGPARLLHLRYGSGE